MKLTCYALRHDAPPIRAAPATRPWMDGVIDNHAYRCLPLNIANGHGWEVLSPCAVTATWTGGDHPNTLTLRGKDGAPPPAHLIVSHFGYGIITFHLSYLFRTEPGWNLLATGSFNGPKDGVAPLTGVIESDWLPYPFTMNWKLTRPGTIEFAEGEPVCMIFPLPHGSLQEVEPEIVDIRSAPELHQQMGQWAQRRAELMRQLYVEPRALKDAWLRDYFVGKGADGAPVAHHLPKLRVKDPTDRRAAKKPAP